MKASARAVVAVAALGSAACGLALGLDTTGDLGFVGAADGGDGDATLGSDSIVEAGARDSSSSQPDTASGMDVTSGDSSARPDGADAAKDTSPVDSAFADVTTIPDAQTGDTIVASPGLTVVGTDGWSDSLTLTNLPHTAFVVVAVASSGESPVSGGAIDDLEPMASCTTNDPVVQLYYGYTTVLTPWTATVSVPGGTGFMVAFEAATPSYQTIVSVCDPSGEQANASSVLTTGPLAATTASQLAVAVFGTTSSRLVSTTNSGWTGYTDSVTGSLFEYTLTSGAGDYTASATVQLPLTSWAGEFVIFSY